MGWSFRRRIKVIPGVYLNVSKRGVSATVGIRGASFTFRDDGIYSNVGIPGTGIYNRQKISGSSTRSSYSNRLQSRSPEDTSESQFSSGSADYHFVSADPLEIVSPGLQGLQSAVLQANQQKHQLKSDLTLIYKSIDRTRLLVALSKLCLLYFFISPLRRYLLKLLENQEQAADEVKSSIQSSSVSLDIVMDQDLEDSYEYLLSSFERLSDAECIWDITSASDLDKVKLRSVASSAITRTRTRFSFSHLPGIDSPSPAFHLLNANGADIFIYPGFFVMYENPSRLGILELADLRVAFERTGFLETETVPQDSKQLSEVWERSNKDGSRDKRYADNRQLPVMEYGEITFTSDTGIYEKYMVSDCSAAESFATALQEFIESLHS